MWSAKNEAKLTDFDFKKHRLKCRNSHVTREKRRTQAIWIFKKVIRHEFENFSHSLWKLSKYCWFWFLEKVMAELTKNSGSEWKKANESDFAFHKNNLMMACHELNSKSGDTKCWLPWEKFSFLPVGPLAQYLPQTLKQIFQLWVWNFSSHHKGKNYLWGLKNSHLGDDVSVFLFQPKKREILNTLSLYVFLHFFLRKHHQKHSWKKQHLMI